MLVEGISFKVCVLYLPNGDSPLLDFLLTLGETDPKAFAKSVASIKQLSDPRRHNYPHTRPLKGVAKGLFELRIIGGQQRLYLRFPFFLSSEREVILLFGEKKKSAEPTQKFIKQAIALKGQYDRKEASYGQYEFGETE